MKYWPVHLLLKKFVKSDSGVILILFAFGLIALLGAGGVAVDYGYAYRLQARLKEAADSAILTSLGGRNYARVIKNKELSLTEKIFHESLALKGASPLHNLKVNVDLQQQPSGYGVTPTTALRITATAETPTFLMHLLGTDKVELGVVSRGEINLSADAVDAVLALDNSYSLTAAEITEIANASYEFSSTLLSIGHPEMYIGVVPFTGTVNMGRNLTQYIADDSTHEFLGAGGIAGMPFFTHVVGCIPVGPINSVPVPQGNGTDRVTSIDDPLFKQILDFFIGTAHAADPVITDMPGSAPGSGCRMFTNPLTFSFETLFGSTGTQWKGCVMARRDPYDANDALPTPSDRSTMFQRFFFPDEADNTPASTDPSMDFDNDWLDDDFPAEFDAGVVDYANAAQHTLYYYKYENETIRVQENWNTSSFVGPNRGCGEEILPLTTNLVDIQNKLNDMKPMEGSGTLTSEGIAWGWRVLSPTKPFAGPHPYAENNKKYIVLFTDGENGARPLDVTPILTDYTAYMWSAGWQWLIGRKPPQTEAETMNRDLISVYANDKVLEVSKNFLANPGTELFVLLYDKTGTLEAKVRPLYESATGNPQNVLVANNFADIKGKFLEIAARIMVPRLLPDH